MAKKEVRREHIRYLESRFGILEEAFDGYLMFETKRSWWLLKNSSYCPSLASLKVYTYGLKAFQRVGRFVKPTTRMIQIFGPMATKAVVNLDEKQFHASLCGEELFPEPAIEDGYVIVSVDRQVVGLGLLIRGGLRLQIRKGERMLILS